jgi:hypothetical protein
MSVCESLLTIKWAESQNAPAYPLVDFALFTFLQVFYTICIDGATRMALLAYLLLVGKQVFLHCRQANIGVT